MSSAAWEIPAEALRSHMPTRQFWDTRWRVRARPMPEAAPVMRATFGWGGEEELEGVVVVEEGMAKMGEGLWSRSWEGGFGIYNVYLEDGLMYSPGADCMECDAIAVIADVAGLHI